MQNPMMQEMMRNNPNIPPHMRQQMETIVNNPAMIDQIARQMQNPAMRAQMDAMMTARGSGTNMSGLMPSTSPNGAGSIGGNNNTTIGTSPLPSGPRPSQGNDQDQTEEEMIAEAIRRSLEEQ
jgi:hypothetical protein